MEGFVKYFDLNLNTVTDPEVTLGVGGSGVEFSKIKLLFCLAKYFDSNYFPPKMKYNLPPLSIIIILVEYNV